jgi:hypothetical protein
MRAIIPLRSFIIPQNAVTLSSLSAQDPETQLNLHRVLGKPNVIRPKPGDLVLLCAQRVSGIVIFHCVCWTEQQIVLDVKKSQPRMRSVLLICTMSASLRGWFRRRREGIIAMLLVL